MGTGLESHGCFRPWYLREKIVVLGEPRIKAGSAVPEHGQAAAYRTVTSKELDARKGLPFVQPFEWSRWAVKAQTLLIPSEEEGSRAQGQGMTNDRLYGAALFTLIGQSCWL